MNSDCKLRRRPSAPVALAACLLAIGAGMLTPSNAPAQTASAPTLEQRLTFGLQARLPSEIAFVQAVVDTVNRGELPLRIVDRTFFFARRRAQRNRSRVVRRPYLFFERVLLLQTDQLGITIAPNP